MAKQRRLSKKQTEDALHEIDDWTDYDDLFSDDQFEAVQAKTKPTPQEVELPTEPEITAVVERRKPVYRYEERQEFDPEAYDQSRQLVPPDHIEYEVTPEPEMKLKKAFRPPKSDPVFRQKWNQFIHNVTARDNFNRGHLEQLAILCDLYVEYEILITSLKRTGYTYIVNTVIGAIPKPYPEVAQLNRTRGEIRNYSRMLGLVLVKDKSEKLPDEDEWE